MFNIGDRVIVRTGPDKNGGTAQDTPAGLKGKVISLHTNVTKDRDYVKLDTSNDHGVWSDQLDLITKPGVYDMFKVIGADMKAFIADNKSAIYMIAVMFLADHILFQGAFRERLHGIMNKLLGKVEAQIDGNKPVALIPEKKV
jgi:hypothetical protein